MATMLEWSFDEASGAVVDHTGNGRGFSLTGNSARTAAGGGYTFGGSAPNSKALTITGTDTQVGPAITGLNTTARTMMAWVRTSSSDPCWFLEYHRTAEDTGVWGFLLLGGTLRFRAKNSSNTAFERTITADTTNYHHLAVTHDGTNLKVYRDGTQVGADVSMPHAVWTADTFRVFDGSQNAFLDHVRVFDTALSSADITTWMNTATPTSSATDLVIQDATHSTSSDSPTLTRIIDLAIQKAVHAQTAEAPNLSLVTQITIHKAFLASTADSPSFSQVHNLQVQDAVHATRADTISLVGPGFGGFMSISDIQVAKMTSITGATGSIQDLMFAYYSALSGLTPVQNFTVADHQRAYWEAQTGLTGRSLADLEKAFYDGLLIAAGSLADREFTYWAAL